MMSSTSEQYDAKKFPLCAPWDGQRSSLKTRFRAPEPLVISGPNSQATGVKSLCNKPRFFGFHTGEPENTTLIRFPYPPLS